MIAKFLARAALTVSGLAVMFANYWFTFGLWPKSWWSFVLCGLSVIVLAGLQLALDKESKES